MVLGFVVAGKILRMNRLDQNNHDSGGRLLCLESSIKRAVCLSSIAVSIAAVLPVMPAQASPESQSLYRPDLLNTDITEPPVPEFGAAKLALYKQTANNTAPGTAFSYAQYGYAAVTSPATTNRFTVTAVSTLRLKTTDEQNYFGLFSYATSTDLDAAFPVGDAYTFTARGGSLAGESDTLPINADNYPAIPYLIGNSFRQAKKINPNADFTLNVGYTSTGAASTEVKLIILPLGKGPKSNQSLYQEFVLGGTTSSFVIPQTVIDSLETGVVYTAELINFNTSDIPSSGSFSSATNFDGWESATVFPLEVQ
jgi:hypothetical protein